jgi:hypothetical protein
LAFVNDWMPLSNAVVDKSHPGIDCYHGQLRLVLSVTRLDRPPISDWWRLQEERSMTVMLNRRAFEHAKELINEGRIVLDERDAWSEHRPTAEQENKFIRLHGFAEYGRWYLGINDEKPEQTKGHYEFPYGDFSKLHRCGVLSAENRAGQYQHYDIENAVAHLHGMLDARKGAPASKRTRAASPGKTARGARPSAR